MSRIKGLVKEITVKTAVNRIKKSNLPFEWDLNIYRGCGHGCKYCYARYSHAYLSSSDFSSEIFVKTNIAKQLDKQLSSKSWEGEVINIGGVTDSYQPLETKYRLMREVLEVMIKHGNPVIISTKSDLILRDIDLISELSSKTYVNIAVTVTTMDDETRKIIEPGSSPSMKRFEVMNKFGPTEANTGVHVSPIIPFITDSVENLDEIFAMAKKSNVDYILAGVLYLKGITRDYYLDFIKQRYPDHYQRYNELYGNDKSNMTQYRQNIYSFTGQLMSKYRLTGDYTGPKKKMIVPRLNNYQPDLTSFFDDNKLSD